MSKQRRKDHKRIVLHEQNIKGYERLLSKDFLDFIADDMAWYGLPKYKGTLYRGYLRWISYSAEYQREKNEYLRISVN